MNLKDEYTWHLREPFSGEFDKTHWWEAKGATEVSSIAAIYELARRHPKIGQLRSKLRNAKWYAQELRAPLSEAAEQTMLNLSSDDLGKEPNAVHCLCLIGLKSWPALNWRYKDFWEASVGKIKGVDCRDDSSRCTSVPSLVLTEILLQRAVAMKPARNALQFRVSNSRTGGGTVVESVYPDAQENFNRRLVKDLKNNPISKKEIESGIAKRAIDAHREGKFLFAIVPDLTYAESSDLLSKRYAEEQKIHRHQKQRARWNDWLPLIKAFENEELSTRRMKSSVFTKYRRILDSISFTY